MPIIYQNYKRTFYILLIVYGWNMNLIYRYLMGFLQMYIRRIMVTDFTVVFVLEALEILVVVQVPFTSQSLLTLDMLFNGWTVLGYLQNWFFS
jgi:hypothetical protein